MQQQTLFAICVVVVSGCLASRRQYDQPHRHGQRSIELTRDEQMTDERNENKVDTATAGQNIVYSKHHTGRHVCKKISDQPSKTKEAYCKPTFKNYVVRCQGDQTCKGVRLVYETQYKDVVTKSSNELTFSCCPGWTQMNNRSHGCNKATCSKACLNGGKCVRPDLCACLKGFNGPQCEILTNASECSKPCQNGSKCTTGNVCTCSKGYTGPFCELDIDECKEQKPCDQICYNTPGSYYCQCKEDFLLQSDGQSCIKEDNDGGLEAKDLEFELLDKRLHKLETMMGESLKNVVSQDDLRNAYKDINHLSKDINNLKTKMDDVESYKRDIYIFKTKLNSIEQKAEKVDDLVIKYDRIKKCAFYSKICI